MKYKLALLFLLMLAPLGLQAAEQATVLEVQGFGISYEDAVRNALIEAVKQARGVSIDSQKTCARALAEKRVSRNGKSSHAVESKALSEGIVREATRGLINEYRVIDSKKVAPGEWEVKVAVKMLRYRTPGNSPDNRRRIAIIPFHTTRTAFEFQGRAVPSREIVRQFNQKLVTEMTQTRRFTVLDREYMEDFLGEKKLILSGDAPVAEQMKIGEVLGVDYLLIGTITEAGQRRSAYEVQLTGEKGYKNKATFVADYRIVVMATRQVKWSDSVTLSLDDAAIKKMVPGLQPEQIQQAVLGLAAREVVHRAMENIYPIRVAKVQPGGEIILNQGGVTVAEGEVLDVFLPGEKIVDPYTGESLGSSEKWIATVEIVRVIPKMSYARVARGDGALVRSGSICRRTDAVEEGPPPAAGNQSGVRNTSGGGVVLPFD